MKRSTSNPDRCICGELVSDHYDIGGGEPKCPMKAVYPVSEARFFPPRGTIRKFETGATRNLDEDKLDYEAFLSPIVLHRYAQYMHAHRKQADGTLRDGDNWQKGIPLKAYLKSLVRHTIDFWAMNRGIGVVNHDTGESFTKEELACAIMFNIMGWLHETLTPHTKENIQ